MRSFTGYHHSEETKRKMSKAKKRRTWEEIYGVEKAQKMKEEMSKRLKGKTKSEKQKENMRLGAIKRWTNSKERKKQSERLTGRKLTEEHIKNISKNHVDVSNKNNPKYKDGRSLRINRCIDCNKRLKSYRSKRCNVCCNIGEKNPNWFGGTSFEPYGIEFNKKLREEIRKRDNYTCQECGYTQEMEHTLHVHHIDFNKTNNHPNNLISLCRSCHNQTRFNRQAWINYFQDKINQRG